MSAIFIFLRFYYPRRLKEIKKHDLLRGEGSIWGFRVPHSQSRADERLAAHANGSLATTWKENKDNGIFCHWGSTAC